MFVGNPYGTGWEKIGRYRLSRIYWTTTRKTACFPLNSLCYLLYSLLVWASFLQSFLPSSSSVIDLISNRQFYQLHCIHFEINPRKYSKYPVQIEKIKYRCRLVARPWGRTPPIFPHFDQESALVAPAAISFLPPMAAPPIKTAVPAEADATFNKIRITLTSRNVKG